MAKVAIITLAKIELNSTFISYHKEGNSNFDKAIKIIQIWGKAPDSKLKKVSSWKNAQNPNETKYIQGRLIQC